MLTKEQKLSVAKRLLLVTPEGYFGPFKKWNRRKSPPAKSVAALYDNLFSAVLVGTTPFRLISSSFDETYLSLLAYREYILGPTEDTGHVPSKDEESRRAFERAKQTLSAERSNPNFYKEHAPVISNALYGALQAQEFSIAADELLRQVAVMIWSSFEVFAADLALETLNHRPDLSTLIFRSTYFKNQFGSKGIDIDHLAQHDFDVSKSMGQIVLTIINFQRIEAIREVYSTMFSDEKINAAMKSNTLWTLNQRRHLIVHRRGIVDQEYCSKTVDKIPIGKKLLVFTDDIGEYLLSVRNASLLMASAAKATISAKK